jgi:hypothetical protein
VGRSATETLQAYLEGQSRSTEDALRFIADDAVFDVGRGRYEGHEEIRAFVERLRAVNSSTSVVELRDVSATEAVALFEQRDDDLGPLGIESIQLNVRVETNDDGRIKTFTARPTPESIDALTAARGAGRSSDGIRLAEQAGTLPPDKGT